ncbi:MAG: hypothetical protein JWN92_710 [Candidatus Acidoferrum typicum]|nr:hypothetical protein [Candidatus Acidoferrum typicum]
MPTRDILTSGVGSLIIGNKQFDGIHYKISGTKRSRLVGSSETVLSVALRGEILNPQSIDSATQQRTLDMECQLLRSDGRVIAVEFFRFPAFQVVRGADGDSWSDAVLGG